VKLGDHRVVARKRVVIGGDDYGNDVVRDVDTLVRWCSVTPTRSTENETRSAPAVAGATVVAPVAARVIEAADAILWPITGEAKDADGRTVYTGRQWEVVGDVGQWDTYTEFQIRRAS
jgi:hypothetical protein